jgi:hypothetical protein
LLERVFEIDMEHCPNCGGGDLKIIAAILERPGQGEHAVAAVLPVAQHREDRAPPGLRVAPGAATTAPRLVHAAA